MIYESVIQWLMISLGFILWLFPLHYTIIFIVSLFAKPKYYNVTNTKLDYGVIICARNEENVIVDLIKSIKKSKYDANKIKIFVIAHNCTDKTADVARKEGGVIVYEYSNPNERTKGFALKKIFEFIDRDFGIQSLDGYHIFDADNILDENYLSKMNDAFTYWNRQHIITSFRNSKNFGANIQTANYGQMFVVCSTFESNGRMMINGTSRILGSGFLVGSDILKNGWNITIPSDDTDLTIQEQLQNRNIKYCHEAMYYDEHPTKFKDMWRQRLRWAIGTWIVCRKRFKELFKSIFKLNGKKNKEHKSKAQRTNRINLLDLLLTILPAGFIGIIILILHLCLIGMGYFFGARVLILLASLGWVILFTTTGLWLWLFFIGMLAYIVERKRIRGVAFITKFISLFTWPFFALLLVPLQVCAMFVKTNKFIWSEIKHNSLKKH